MLDVAAIAECAYDDAGRVTSSRDHSEQSRRDANGNTALEDNNGALTSYSWDLENRMTQAQLPAGGLNTMSYYGDGKRRRYGDSAGGTWCAF